MWHYFPAKNVEIEKQKNITIVWTEFKCMQSFSIIEYISAYSF